jgi:hypothetical protein
MPRPVQPQTCRQLHGRYYPNHAKAVHEAPFFVRPMLGRPLFHVELDAEAFVCGFKEVTEPSRSRPCNHDV